MLTQSSEKCVVDKDRKAGRRKQNLIRIREEVWFDSHTARDSVLLVLGLVLKHSIEKNTFGETWSSGVAKKGRRSRGREGKYSS